MRSAIISGRMGIAVIGGALPEYAIRLGSLDKKVEVTPIEARILLREATDLEYQVDVDDSSIRMQLELASESAESLDLLLILLDGNLSGETRKCAAAELEELVSSDLLVNRLQQLLFAKPLPPAADVEGALQAARDFCGVSSFLCDLRHEQPSIKAVRDAWNILTLDQEQRSAFEAAFLAYGVFAGFAKALTAGTRLSELVLQFGLNSALKSEVPTVAHVLDAWRRQLPVQLRRPSAATAQADAFFELDLSQTDGTNGHSSSGPIHAKAEVARNAALTQVTRVAELVNQGADIQAKQILEELVEEQMRHRNGETHAVKSLCNIAARIRGTGREDFALDCLLRALDLSADSVAFTQLGTLLRDFEKYDESRQAYDKAVALADPNDVYGLQMIYAAKAHILTEQEHYDEAIAAYEAIPFHTSSPSIETSIADVYRRKGCFSIAMMRYLNLIATYKGMDRAFAGKAEIAKRRGDPHRAIRLYNRILRDDDEFHVEDKSRVVYQLAKSHLLKMVGQWDQAFDIVTDIANQEPYNVQAQLQLASLLAINGQGDESLAHIPHARQTEKNWHVHYFRGLTYFRIGRIEEAKVEILEQLKLAKVFLEDRPLVSAAAAFMYLADGDTKSAAKALESMQSVDRRVLDLREVLVAHISAVTKVGCPRFPRLRRSSVHLRGAVQSIRKGNVAEAIAQELLFLLKAA